jgi:hypothetical protein
MEPKTGTLVCRKCGGPHLTMRCGKDKPDDPPVEKIEQPVERKRIPYNEMKQTYDKKHNITPVQKVKEFSEFVENDKTDKSDRQQKPRFRKTYCVKLSNLPLDMTEEELMEMTCDWGEITRLKVMKFDDNAVAYIDFTHEDMATYFVEAIDKTPLEYMILSASIMQNNKE